MNRFLSMFIACFVALILSSCGDDSIYPGFEKMENGAYMKFYVENESEAMPRIGDEVTFEMAQYFDDSMLFTTVGIQPIKMVLPKADFKGDVVDGLLMMHVGDSASLVVPADSLFIVMLGMDTIPEEFAGKVIYYDLKLLEVKPAEVIQAERDSLREAEKAFLASFAEDPNNQVTESGLIILEQKGKGRLAKLGDYLDLDFTLCTHLGDTIMNSFGVEPLIMQYGEDFLGPGFDEAVGIVPEGGTIRCVIPSSLAFDSIGYDDLIQPYTPMIVVMKLNQVMDEAALEKRMTKLEAERKSELERLQHMESQTISDYIKANGITEKPTKSGLYIIPVAEGNGNFAQRGDVVSVHFIMSNLKGDVIDSSYDYGQPMDFQVGYNQGLPAMEEALLTMAPGAKVILITPSKLAFGDFGINEQLPPYSPLRIELELVEIK